VDHFHHKAWFLTSATELAKALSPKLRLVIAMLYTKLCTAAKNLNFFRSQQQLSFHRSQLAMNAWQTVIIFDKLTQGAIE